MKNLHKISTAILLIVIGLVGGYFLFNSDIFNKIDFTGEVIMEDLLEKEVQIDNLSVENESSNLIDLNISVLEKLNVRNNPPITQEDYVNLLGEIDYNQSYDLFFSATENDSALNYSEDPIVDVVYFLDRFLFWEDEDLYKVEAYWASPNESLNSMKGDDEDYALLALALSNNFHDQNQSCYLVGNEEFAGLFCYGPKYKKYYGEMVVKSYSFYGIYSDDWWQGAGDVWMSKLTLNVDDGHTEQLIRTELRNFIKDFMIEKVGYCCTDIYKNKRQLTYENRTTLKFLYNEEEFHELESTKDFEDWIYNNIEDQIFGQFLTR